jgi:molybdopterin converting factor subunit 1
MQKVKIFFFANLRDYIGSKSVEIEIPIGITVSGLIDLLVLKFPNLEKVRDSMMVAVNREYAANEQVIPQGGEIAFFPPVSGGCF